MTKKFLKTNLDFSGFKNLVWHKVNYQNLTRGHYYNLSRRYVTVLIQPVHRYCNWGYIKVDYYIHG